MRLAGDAQSNTIDGVRPFGGRTPLFFRCGVRGGVRGSVCRIELGMADGRQGSLWETPEYEPDRERQAERTKRAAPKKRTEQAKGFDFSTHMRFLCQDICERLPEMQHIRMPRVAVSFSQARKSTEYGMYASLTPMRFRGGATEERRGDTWFAVQRVLGASGEEMLYVLNFYLPRFMNLPYKEKLVTIFHELWHMSPEFNGDIRRHSGRCYAHTHSGKEYDANMGVLLEKWLSQRPPAALYSFLQCNFRQLQRRHGHVFGVKIKHPKLYPLRKAQ